ncbi:MAG: T9SS type A sorting domain-containing protein, partial [Saprospiraceae bacterium]
VSWDNEGKCDEFDYDYDNFIIKPGKFLIDYVRVYKPKNYNPVPPAPKPKTANYQGDPMPTYTGDWDKSVILNNNTLASGESISPHSISVYNGNTPQDLKAYFILRKIVAYKTVKIQRPGSPWPIEIEVPIFKNFLCYVHQSGGSWNFVNTGVDNLAYESDIAIDQNTGRVFYEGSDNYLWFYNGVNGLQISGTSNLSGDLKFDEYHNRIYFRNGTNLSHARSTGFNTWVVNQTVINNIAAGGYDIRKSTGKLFYKSIDKRLYQYAYSNSQGVGVRYPVGPSGDYDVYGAIEFCIANNKPRVYYKNGSDQLFYWEYTSGEGWSKQDTYARLAKDHHIVARNNEYGSAFYIDSGTNEINSYNWNGDVVAKALDVEEDQITALQSIDISEHDTKVFFIDNEDNVSYFEWTQSFCGVQIPTCVKNGCFTSCTIPVNTKAPPVSQNRLIQPTSTDLNLQTSELKVYPNPTTDFITIEKVSKDEQIEFVEIYDTNGRLILSRVFNSSSARMRLGELQDGIYFYHVKTATNFYTGRVTLIRNN